VGFACRIWVEYRGPVACVREGPGRDLQRGRAGPGRGARAMSPGPKTDPEGDEGKMRGPAGDKPRDWGRR